MVKISLIILTLAGFISCTEPNPDYDPNYEPPCKAGTLSCNDESTEITVCIKDDTNTMTWQTDRTCWEDTLCSDGFCAPESSISTCETQSECPPTYICTALADSKTSINSYCIKNVNPEGRDGGYACSSHDSCKSGWCFRNTCFTPCMTSDDCPLDTECTTLNITIDNIQDSVLGCTIQK
ncbi:MAG: hypothetical protein JXR95_14340 [Deltaproteobacteria bacterium]|nr:hypothetical protein [Deltaproteobacteria bacterium]